MKPIFEYLLSSNGIKKPSIDLSDRLKKWPSSELISIESLVDLLDELDIHGYHHNSWSSSMPDPDMEHLELAYGYNTHKKFVTLYSNPDNEIQGLSLCYNDGHYHGEIFKGGRSFNNLTKSDVISMMKEVILDPNKTWDLKKPWLL